MDRQEQVRQQRQMIEEQRQRFYEMNPDVADWITMKKVIRNIVLLYCVVHTVLTVIVMLQMEPHGSIVMEIAKLLFQMLWVCVFINPEGSWRFSLILYLWAASNLVMVLQHVTELMDALAYLFYQPLYGIVLIMETMVPFLFLIAAIFLTAFPRHREWSDRAYEFQKQMTEMIKQMGR